eukprot:GFYU01004845.1.p2 GENE.GFYU01004845.1~~GFYU01004845.1.p2  ORF type:complete len:130 (+),score=38.82 GFYU01004845.1:39-428(+)
MASKGNSASMSFLFCVVLSIIVFALLQAQKPFFAGSEMGTIAGGIVASLIFVFSLTAIGNLEQMVGKSETHWIEVFLAMMIAGFAAGSVHRVCVTVCILSSFGWSYYLNNLAHSTYRSDAPVEEKKKRR